MNDNLARTLALLAALTLAGPAAAFGADRGPSLSAAATASTTSDKADEAKRLATMAAELAQRAAQLAAESQASAPSAAASGQASAADSSRPVWSPRDAAEVEITDAGNQSSTSGPSLASGWRRHRKASEVAIRFMGDSSSSTAAQAAAPAKIESAGAGSPSGSNPSAAAIGSPASLAAAAAAQSGSTPDAAAANGASENHPLNDANVQLAARTFQDEDEMIPDAEPVPPAPPYNDRNGNGRNRSDDDGDGHVHNGHNGDYCGCDTGCASECCPPQRMLFWSSGVEATFLSPDLNGDGASFDVVESSNGRDDYFSTLTDDVDSFYFSPRFWFGVQGCKWGANFRYWHLQAGEGSFDPTLGSDGEWDGPGCGTPNFGYTSCTHLEAYTIDLEITRRLCLNDCAMLFSAGVRHANISYDELISGTALADDSQVFGFATGQRNTRGTGLVLGWYGRRPIFPCSCVHWFYNVRASAVWGPTQTAAETGVMLALQTTDPDAVGNAGSVNGAATNVDDDLFIGEFQIGLEWDYALQCLPANAFCRAAIEYQRWTGGVGYSAASSFAGVQIDDGVNPPVTSTLATAFASAAEPDLDLLGIAVSTGLTW